MTRVTHEQLESLQAYDFLYPVPRYDADDDRPRCQECGVEVDSWDDEYCDKCILIHVED